MIASFPTVAWFGINHRKLVAAIPFLNVSQESAAAVSSPGHSFRQLELYLTNRNRRVVFPIS